MPTAPNRIYTNRGVMPFYPGAMTKAVKLPASISYPKGTILGEITGTNEVQSIVIAGTPGSGGFTLSFGGYTTDSIAYNATAAAVEAALVAIASLSGNAVQTLDDAGSPTGGTFTLSYGGAVTVPLAYNATAAAVQAALEALPQIGSGNVTCSGGALGTAITITFGGFLAGLPIPALSVNYFQILPSTASITCTVVNPGGGGIKNVSVTKARSEWTLTEAAGTDGGTYQLRITCGGSTYDTVALAWDAASTTTMDAAIEALPNIGTAGVAATGSAGGPYTLLFAPALGDVLVEVVNDSTADGGVIEGGVTAVSTVNASYLVTFQGSLASTNVAAMTTADTFDQGSTTIATVTAGAAGTGVWTLWSPTATNGSQIAKGILEFDCTTDSSGNITFGQVSTGDQWGGTYTNAPAFIQGYFHTKDLVNLTATAIAHMGRLVSGTIANGILRLN